MSCSMLQLPGLPQSQAACWACIAAHLAAMRGTKLWIQSSGLIVGNLCIKDLIIHAEKAVVASRGPELGFGPTWLQRFLMPGEATVYSGAGASFLRFWRPTVCRFTVQRGEGGVYPGGGHSSWMSQTGRQVLKAPKLPSWGRDVGQRKRPRFAPSCGTRGRLSPD